MCFRETFFTALQQESIYDLLRVSFPVQIYPLFFIQVHRFGLGCIKLSTSKGNKVHLEWYSDWSMCTVFFLRIEFTAVPRCARKSTEFASGSKIIDENRGDMEGSSIVDEPEEG